jgi:hypothetical protein
MYNSGSSSGCEATAPAGDLVGSSKQAVAHAGSPVVAVLSVLVYVAQKSCPDRIKRLAHSSVTALTHARVKEIMTLETMRNRMAAVV